MSSSVKTCAISGASGFIGGNIASLLSNQGWKITELGRRPSSAQTAPKTDPSNKFIHWNFNEPISLEGAPPFDLFVHCAWDMTLSSWDENYDRNVRGSLALAEQLLPLSQRAIFISTMSSFEGAQSVYGRSKLLVERWFIDRGAFVVRPGLVLGKNSGGMVGALSRIARLSPIIPIPGNGRQKFFTCQIEDLCSLILYLANCDRPQPGTPNQNIFTAANSNSIEFKDLLARLGKADHGRTPIFIPVPWRPIYWGLKAAEEMGLKIRIKSDSLLSMMTPNPNPDLTTLKALPLTFKPPTF